MEATPRPWRLAKSSVRSSFATNWRTIEPNVVGVGTFTRTSEWGGDETCSGVEISEANAEFIVRAVNAHDRLVEALETLVGEIESSDTEWGISSSLLVGAYLTRDQLAEARAALGAARGEVEA